MWYNHLKEIVTKKTQISELDSILGIKDDDDMEHETIGNVALFLYFTLYLLQSSISSLLIYSFVSFKDYSTIEGKL